jgi:molecular chaperone GrpE (heat shock protein)
VGTFQNACRDAARRVGLTPFMATDAEPFDAQRHQLVEEGAQPPPDAVVGETVATGYTFQGRLVRPALVRLRDNAAAVAAAGETGPEKQSRLPLETPDGKPE